jgi:benzoylformate decarboxylase
MRPVQALLEIARSEGVDRIFGNPGTTELPLLDALVDPDALPYVLGLHEGSVVAMADGYARATRRPALVSLHVAAGTANGLIGMLNASRSRTPMVVIAGQQDRRHLLHDPMLSGDLVGLARAAVKSAIEVQHAADLPLVLRRAFAEASRPPSGPVFVSVPLDLLEEEVELAVPPPSPVAGLGAATRIDVALDLLAGAANPVIIAGDGVGRDGAVAELVALAEELGATVLPQPMYDRINMPGNHPLCAVPPVQTYAAIRAALAPYDLVFVVGAHAFMAHHYTPGSPIPDGAEVLQLDTDPAEIGRNFPVRLGLVGAFSPTLRALAVGLRGRVPDAARRAAEVSARVAADRAGTDTAVCDAAVASRGGTLHPLAAAGTLARALPPDAVVVEEAITTGALLRRVLRLDRPDSYAHTIGGGLGWGIGAAIGTRMGTDRPVVAVLGDGCATFGLQGLWTAARHEVPVAFVVMDNGEYRVLKDALDRNKSRSTAAGRYVGMDLRGPRIAWSAAALAFGVTGVRANSADELAELIARVGDLTGPLLIEVPISAHTPPP